MQGALATVEESTPGTMKVCSVASPPIRPILPADYLDVLTGWGQTWIWDDLKVTGGTDWVAQAITDNSLVAVTDRSLLRSTSQIYAPWPLCWNAFRAGADWLEHLQKHQRRQTRIVENYWG